MVGDGMVEKGQRLKLVAIIGAPGMKMIYS